ncbi:MAG: cyclophilin-like fold protein [Candidatus Omnitrophota bacterium]
MRVSFQTPTYNFIVEFNGTRAAREVISSLPLDSKISVWGDEIYFKTGIRVSLGQDTTDVNIGDVAYWREGQCLCVFFGATPLSTGDKPVPASGVILIGKTEINPQEARKIKDGDPVRVAQITPPKEEIRTGQPAVPDKKLSQDEIDTLVKQLLEEKKKKQEKN